MQITLPTGSYAYGRVLRDASVAFYRETTSAPEKPPIGSRDYQFVVGVYEDVLPSSACPIVGHDPSTSGEDDWPPPTAVRDPITGNGSVYHHGAIHQAVGDEWRSLEPAAVWDLHHLVERLVHNEPDIDDHTANF